MVELQGVHNRADETTVKEQSSVEAEMKENVPDTTLKAPSQAAHMF